MLICNLRKILDEKDIPISRLYEKTGISRDTITKLTTNAGSGVHFDTIEKICKHLGITMDELFTHIPATLEFKKDWLPDQLPDDINLKTHVTFHHDTEKHSPVKINLHLSIFGLDFDTPIDEMKLNALFYYFYKSAHMKSIKEHIANTLRNDLNNKFGNAPTPDFVFFFFLQNDDTPKDITGNTILYLLEQQKTTQSEE